MQYNVNETFLLPVFFNFQKVLARCTQTGEIEREKSVFVSLLVVVSLECVLAVQKPGRNVLVICYLQCVEENLRNFFRYALAGACWHWHRALKLGAAASDRYDFETLTTDKRFGIVGPLRCKGMTADVVFVLTMKRRWADTKYQGMAIQPKLRGVHYTRCRLRVYAFLHDLTDDIELPPAGKNLKRGLDLGADLSCIAENPGNVKPQLFFLNLKKWESKSGRILLMWSVSQSLVRVL